MLRLAGGAAAVASVAPSWLVAAAGGARRMGVTTACYGIRWRVSSADGTLTQFRDALAMLEHCHRLGAGGIQVGIGAWDAGFIATLRSRLDEWQMFLEGQIALPKDESETARFDKEIRAAREAGADIVRTVCLSGRRYEDFDTAAAWRQFTERSWNSLTLAEPIVRRQRVRLAVENHKDWRVPELLGLLKRLSSEWLGVCVDFGNSLSLLEDPLEVIEAYAPFAFTTHFKDMGVEEYDEGFLLSEVPLGEGFLDLKQMIATLRRAKPEIRINLEMITRDPLKVPVLGRKYWASAADVPAKDLARTWALVRQHPPRKPLPRVTGLSQDAHLKFEEENVEKCLAYSANLFGA